MIKSLAITGIWQRVLLIAGCLACLTACYFFVEWCLGNALAVRAPEKEVAQWAIDYAPRDPQTHYALAVLNQETFLPEDLSKSLAEYEKSVTLAPQDFRLWLALGKARERSGDPAGAELAFRRTLALAPNYAEIQWTLGNALLRNGKIDEAFSEMTRAAENDANYRTPLISTAWQIFDGDPAAVRERIGNAESVKFALAAFLAGQKQFDAAVEVWNELPAENKKGIYKADGAKFLAAMLAAKNFRAALRIQQSIEDKPDGENFAVGRIYNGNFEQPLTRELVSPFDWQIGGGEQPQVGPNNVAHGGANSLMLIFNSTDGRDFRQVAQLVAVEANKKYTLEFYSKADLKTAARLQWEIIDASDGKVLAVTGAIPDSADWTAGSVEWTTAAATEAVVVRLGREACKSIICPISGTIRFDDISLK